MSSFPLLDYAASQQAKTEGINRALEHAGSTWLESAIQDFLRYLQAHPGSPLEDWRADYLERGCEPPESHKAFGALANTAVRRGLIRCVGYVKARSVKTHGHRVAVYRIKGEV